MLYPIGSRRLNLDPRRIPGFHIIKAWLFILTGQPERAEEVLQIAEKLISSLEADTEIKIMQGAIATGRSYRSFMDGDTNRTATFARQAVEYLPDVDLVSRSIRSIATALLGEASLMNGELEGGPASLYGSKADRPGCRRCSRGHYCQLRPGQDIYRTRPAPSSC